LLGLRLARRNRRETVSAVWALFGIALVQLGHGAVQHFLREAARERFQHGVDVFALGQQLFGAGDFQRTPFVGLGIDLLDQRTRRPRGCAGPSSA
jgi:hypothetical protein